MKHVIKSLALASAIFVTGSALIMANSESGSFDQTDDVAVAAKSVATDTSFHANSQVLHASDHVNARLPSVADMAEVLLEDGVKLMWADEAGNPLTLSRKDNEILVERQSGPTSRFKLTQMSPAIVPQISASAVAMTN